jgi:hypothetical protein
MGRSGRYGQDGSYNLVFTLEDLEKELNYNSNSLNFKNILSWINLKSIHGKLIEKRN